MANAGPNTNGSQFFIMHQDYPLPPNYVIFARVTAGMEVVDALADTPTTSGPGGEPSKPLTPPVIKKVTIRSESVGGRRVVYGDAVLTRRSLTMTRRHLAFAALTILLGVALAAQRQAGNGGEEGADSSNMELVGYDDLQGRSAYQPVIQRQGNRWIAYVGHHGGSAVNPLTGKEEPNGTSIVDVTDPKQPEVPGAHSGSARRRPMPNMPDGRIGRRADGAGVQRQRAAARRQEQVLPAARVRQLRRFGHEIWDVTDPARPSRINVIVGGLNGTHKSWWECDTGIAYLVSGQPGWRVPRMTKIYDLSDPAKPVFIRDFGLPGQQPGSTGSRR